MTAPTKPLPELPICPEPLDPRRDDHGALVYDSRTLLDFALAYGEQCFALGQQTARDVQAAALVVAEANGYAAGKAYQASLAARDVQAEAASEDDVLCAYRYRQLRVVGVAPCGTKQLDNGTVLRFTNLDAWTDEYTAAHPDGQARAKFLAAPPASDVQPVGAVADVGGFVVLTQEQAADAAEISRFASNKCNAAALGMRAGLTFAAAPALQGESGATLSATIETAAEMAENFFLRFDNPEHLAASIRALAPPPTQSGATVADQRDAARWISVEDRLPKDGTICLVAVIGGIVIDTWQMQREAPLSFSSATIETGLMWDDHEFEEITHWMPLPSLPPQPEPEQDAAGEQS